MPVCANKASNGSVSADQGLSTTSEDRCHPWAKHVVTMPIPLSHSFLLVQNLSLKRIAPTDNMWTKSEYAKEHHQWLKG